MRPRSYIVSMKVGDLIEYINLDGDVVYGVVCRDTYRHQFGRLGIQDAVQVAWTDDASITTEVLEDILDPEVPGLELL